MTDIDFGTDHMGVPLRYSAEWHYGGCLPDTDVLYWETPREAWNDLIERLTEWEGMWDGENKSDFHLALIRRAEDNEPGYISDSTGMIYAVEDTHVMTCGEPACRRTFPDIYPSGRCPYEANHDIYRAFESAVAAQFVFSRANGAR